MDTIFALTTLVSVPLRGLMILNESTRWIVQVAQGEVSVPLRGLMILNIEKSKNFCLLADEVSVPLRGLMILNENAEGLNLDFEFPSPYGV